MRMNSCLLIVPLEKGWVLEYTLQANGLQKGGHRHDTQKGDSLYHERVRPSDIEWEGYSGLKAEDLHSKIQHGLLSGKTPKSICVHIGGNNYLIDNFEHALQKHMFEQEQEVARCTIMMIRMMMSMMMMIIMMIMMMISDDDDHYYHQQKQQQQKQTQQQNHHHHHKHHHHQHNNQEINKLVN
ncbi:hypothetical protein DPMN_144071 [Dreissena polymorpha]|uniref:Uncharacterized protein n=1 Tax=Dreissena polymorpha TaxID=45954 RepID=A0A9D4GEX1_DREPO|nr:hypothetical protein DPMN_144071 [Dreissena polymorpha]